MSERKRISAAMDAIRTLTADLDEKGYEEFLDQLKYEIEQEIELCFWHSTDLDEEHF